MVRLSDIDTVSTMIGHSMRLRSHVRGLVLIWTLVVAGLLANQLRRQNDEVLQVAALQARSLLQRDLVYRQWVAENSGVYVLSSKMTPPNPYLARLPSRDMQGAGGRRFTLVNPAYMSRLVYELAAKQDGSHSHITSLRPVRRENAPDQWEQEALHAFDRGEKECRTLVNVAGRPYFRLMAPLLVSRDCLECHAQQGYRVGQVRGGISVTLPLAELQRVTDQSKLETAVGYGILWLMGMGGIAASSASVRRSFSKHQQAEGKLRYLGTHDALTGCYNRCYFDTEYDRFAKGREFPIAVVMADLDGLKAVNDGQGHSDGDQLIRQAAQVFKQACREADVVARLGGDEFAMLLPGVDQAVLQTVLERIRKCQAAANEQNELQVEFSIGAVCAENADQLRSALKRADQLMYQDKVQRKSTVFDCDGADC